MTAHGRWRITVAMIAFVTLAPALVWGQTYLDGYRGPYRGRVLDAETHEPLVGAVVVAVWLRVRIRPMRSDSVFHAARETLTGPDGSFVLDAKDIEEGAPARTFPPEFLIFAPGYGPWGSRARELAIFLERGFQEGTDLRGGLTIGLPKLRTQEEQRRVIPGAGDLSVTWSDDRGCTVWRQPRETLANFIRLINEARAQAGLEGRVYTGAWDRGGAKCEQRRRSG